MPVDGYMAMRLASYIGLHRNNGKEHGNYYIIIGCMLGLYIM